MPIILLEEEEIPEPKLEILEGEGTIQIYKEYSDLFKSKWKEIQP